MDAFETAARHLERAEALRLLLRGPVGTGLLDEARALLKPLRDQRAWLPLVVLAEVLLRRQPDDHACRRLYAQGLIEMGATSAALALLQGMTQVLLPADPEWAEAWGLIGRCHKQVFAETLAVQPSAALRALHDAAAAYAQPYRADPRQHVWHGVNLLALAGRAAQLAGAPGAAVAANEHVSRFTPAAATLALASTEGGPRSLAATLLQDLLALHLQNQPGSPDPWLLASLAEVSLGRALLDGPEITATEAQADAALAVHWVQQYLQHPHVQAFMVASTLRQFTEIWGLGTAGLLPGWAAQLLDLIRARPAAPAWRCAGADAAAAEGQHAYRPSAGSQPGVGGTTQPCRRTGPWRTRSPVEPGQRQDTGLVAGRPAGCARSGRGAQNAWGPGSARASCFRPVRWACGSSLTNCCC